jgi:hypothetical protein
MTYVSPPKAVRALLPLGAVQVCEVVHAQVPAGICSGLCLQSCGKTGVYVRLPAGCRRKNCRGSSVVLRPRLHGRKREREGPIQLLHDSPFVPTFLSCRFVNVLGLNNLGRNRVLGVRPTAFRTCSAKHFRLWAFLPHVDHTHRGHAGAHADDGF